MPDIDESLRRDADRWRAELRAPDLLSSATRAVQHRERRRPARAGLIASVAATVVLLIAAAAAVVHSASHDPLSRPAIRAGGRSVPYAGPVPWVNPVSDRSDPLVVYVFADNDRIDASNVCAVTADRAFVTGDDGDQVSVEVAGYATALDRGEFCGGVGHSPVPIAVHLAEPLGGRRLVDAHDGRSHRLLDATSVPDLHRLPPRCGRTFLSWDEKSRVATREYSPLRGFVCSILMRYGPPAAVQKLVSAPTATLPPVRIHGALATVSRYVDVNNYGTTVDWSPRPGTRIILTINSAPAHRIELGEVLAVARAIQ